MTYRPPVTIFIRAFRPHLILLTCSQLSHHSWRPICGFHVERPPGSLAISVESRAQSFVPLLLSRFCTRSRIHFVLQKLFLIAICVTILVIILIIILVVSLK